MIEVKNMVKRYGNHLAVDHLSFHVDKGQIYGFLGPNGAGKSTTMNIMTGYLASTEGEVLINGMNILEEPEKVKKCIGYLPEQPPLYIDMTVEEYLKFAADLKKIERTKRKEQIEQVEMTVVKVLTCEKVKKSEKLLKFTLDDGTGTPRQILSGIAKYYQPQELLGKTLVAVTNLAPRKMMGQMSCGMLLSAERGDKLNLLMLDDAIQAGSRLV